MSEGWIKLHRGIMNNPLWTQEAFSRGQAWVDLILMVNHVDKKILFDGGLVECKRGERIISIRQLGERWKWSRGKVTRFLDVLQSDQMIVYKTDHKKTTLSIVNYNVYQDRQSQEKPVNGHKKASDEPVTSHRRATDEPLTDTNKNDKEYIKNDKEGKEGKETVPILPHLSFPTLIHERIFSEFTEVTYRTWFEDCDIEEKGNLITITTKEEFKKGVIQNKYAEVLKIKLGKDISVKSKEGD